jgi:hypothetical protein
MNIQKILSNIAALMNNDGATPAERDAARRAYTRLKQKYPDVTECLQEDSIDVELSYNQKWERYLLVDIAFYLGLEAFRVKDYKGRYLKKTIIPAPCDLEPVIKELYAVHRKKLQERILIFVQGYCQSALPRAVPEPENTEKSELSEELLQIGMTGYQVGKQHLIIKKLNA